MVHLMNVLPSKASTALTAAATTAVLAANVVPVQGQVSSTQIYDAGGFESSAGFSIGPLAGQANNAQPTLLWQRAVFDVDAGATGNVVLVDNEQKVRLTHIAQTGQSRFLGDGYHGIDNLQDRRPDLLRDVRGTMRIGFSMNVEFTGIGDRFGPQFGVQVFDAFDANATPGQPSPTLLAGGIMVDASTGELLTFDEQGVATPVGRSGVTLGQTHEFEILMNFVRREYTVRVDGVAVLRDQGFVDNSNFSGITQAFANDLTDAAFAVQGVEVAPLNSTLTAMATVDDYEIELLRLNGDATGDGFVNLADFGVLRANFGEEGSQLTFNDADFNGDETVNLADFGILRANFGSSDTDGLGLIDAWAATVPEPGVGVLAAAGLGLLMRRERRMR
jgi:hypothetical protein